MCENRFTSLVHKIWLLPNFNLKALIQEIIFLFLKCQFKFSSNCRAHNRSSYILICPFPASIQPADSITLANKRKSQLESIYISLLKHLPCDRILLSDHNRLPCWACISTLVSNCCSPITISLHLLRAIMTCSF